MRNLRWRWKKCLSLFLVLALVFGMDIINVPQAEAAADSNSIYVATTGNDTTGDGTSGKPYKTIKKAAEMATPGTTVLVRAGTYIEENIQPKVSGTEDAMIVFRPETAADIGKVIIKHNDTFTGSTITPAVKDQWLKDTGWTAAQTSHYNDAGIEYSIAGRANKLTDVFNLYNRNYIQIEGFVFRDYKYARNTINIKGTGNVVINNQFINLGCVYSTPWHWLADGVVRGDVTLPVSGSLNVVRNNYFQSVYGETLCYDGGSKDNIITENTFIGAIGKNGDYSGSESSTLGGRFENNVNNAFAFNYSGGSVNGGTIWLDVCVNDFTALRNVAHNTAYFFFNESGCTRNWAYENIVYNKPLDANKRMPADPNFFTDFPAQSIESGLFTAFWDTGSTWDARWVNNVTYNLREGINIERSWRDEVRNNIGYEDAKSQYNQNDTLGLRIFETAVVGFHSWHGLDLKGGGPQIIKNNLWYSTRKTNYVRYMYPTQPAITVADFNAQIGSTTELSADPMFENPAAYDFRLKSGSPAIGTGYNGVDRGAYAVYPKTDVGYNKNLSLLEDVNVSFSKLNSSVKPGDIVNLEVKLNKPATKTMSFEVAPVAGDARIDKDFRFLDSQKVTFAAGERTKTIRIEILAPNPSDEIDQLLALRINPTGTTKLEEVGSRNVHLIKIIRVTKYSVTLNDVGDSMGQSIVQYYKPGETVTIDAKTRDNYTFSKWNTGYHYVKQPLANANSARTTFTMPEWNVTLRAEWNLVGTKVNVTGITMTPATLELEAGKTSPLTAAVQPSNATDKAVLWTSSNPLVATVSNTGVITALSAGKTTITATALDSKYGNNQYRTATCAVTVTGTYKPITPAVMRTDGFYTIRNVNSNRYLEVSGDAIEAGSNVEQGVTAHNFSPSTMWRLAEASNGYYFMRSAADETLVLDIAGELPDNGTNAGLWSYTGGTNQQFKFVQVSDGVYTIRTRITNDASCIEVEGAVVAAGGNVLQWETNGGPNQSWIMEFHDISDITTSATTTTTVTTTTTSETTTSKTTTTVTATVTTTGGDTPLYGDVDGDGTITTADLVQLAKYLGGKGQLTAQGLINAQCHSNPALNGDDLLALIKYLVNRTIVLPLS